jgi:hypothetical protein
MKCLISGVLSATPSAAGPTICAGASMNLFGLLVSPSVMNSSPKIASSSGRDIRYLPASAAANSSALAGERQEFL